MGKRRYWLAFTLGVAGCASFTAAAPGDDAPDAATGDAAADAPLVTPVEGGAGGDAGDAIDASNVSDAAVLLDGAAWTSPNGATWTVMTDGTRITGQSYSHPLIVWVASAATAGADYTVTATIKSPAAASSVHEFGLFARGTVDAGGVVMGSEYGGNAQPFITTFGPPLWNPVTANMGAPYTYQGETRYKMKLAVIGTTVKGKLWEASATEPGADQVTGTAPTATGKLAGYYTYGLHGAVLEAFAITVP
ncbi:MAG: hypothetical protein JWO86_4771 [Myxococcaceae bacterium]|nr:hypothetical protein [Myxococcaceae bacterium]